MLRQLWHVGHVAGSKGGEELSPGHVGGGGGGGQETGDGAK